MSLAAYHRRCRDLLQPFSRGQQQKLIAVPAAIFQRAAYTGHAPTRIVTSPRLPVGFRRPCPLVTSSSSSWHAGQGSTNDSTNSGSTSGSQGTPASQEGETSSSELASSSAQQQPQRDRGPLPVVPWGVGKIAQVMLLWLIAYVIIGQVAVPVTMSLLGLDRDTMSIRSHAILHLGLDVSQLAITLLILWKCLSSFKVKELGLFPVRWRGLWPLLVLAFCLSFPVVDWVAQQSHAWFPLEGDQWANQMEHNLSLGDWITNVSYFCLVSICAPIWEEAIFRGFLLASLARYMPLYAAVVASSLLFAMCHFRLQTFLPLLVLGIIFSSIFLLTRNLLPPIILHSLWNIFVLFNLLFRPA